MNRAQIYGSALGMLSKYWLCSGLLLASCASQAPVNEAPLEIDGVRQIELTADDVAQRLSTKGEDFSRCYAREKLNFDVKALADFVFEFKVPNNGKNPKVAVLSQSHPGQEILSQCLSTVLRRTRFQGHIGKELTLKVPIKAPR